METRDGEWAAKPRHVRVLIRLEALREALQGADPLRFPERVLGKLRAVQEEQSWLEEECL